MDTRIRYSRKNNRAKNTLVTIQTEDSNYIYFGISRCNKRDVFEKKIGRSIAAARAKLALEDINLDLRYGGRSDREPLLEISANGLRGRVREDDIDELLRYFNKVDRFVYMNSLECCEE